VGSSGEFKFPAKNFETSLITITAKNKLLSAQNLTLVILDFYKIFGGEFNFEFSANKYNCKDDYGQNLENRSIFVVVILEIFVIFWRQI
jgi:hypothetical protein